MVAEEAWWGPPGDSSLLQFPLQDLPLMLTKARVNMKVCSVLGEKEKKTNKGDRAAWKFKESAQWGTLEGRT